eukprot:PhF_6_TR37777/c0_g1_i1/m.56239
MSLTSVALTHTRNVLHNVLQWKPATSKLFVLCDNQSQLTQLLATSYAAQDSCGKATVIDVPQVLASPSGKSALFEALDTSKPGDAVAVVQSSGFQYLLGEYRLRLKLFEKNLKVVEHAHLASVQPSEYETYINALGFHHSNHTNEIDTLTRLFSDAALVRVKTVGGGVLEYSGAMEKCLLNTGDYTTNKNVGGSFPIGEIISESIDLETVNGTAMVWAFPGPTKVIEVPPKPFRVTVEKGVVVDDDQQQQPQSFRNILKLVRDAEGGKAWIREFGIGLNSAIGKGNRLLSEPTAFERQRGLHISMGKKHNLFRKRNMTRKEGKYHIDLYMDLETIEVRTSAGVTHVVYKDGDYTV